MMYLNIGRHSIKLDNEDMIFLGPYSWTVNDNGCGQLYAKTYKYDKSKKTQSTIYLHRLIMKAPKGLVVDHINGDTLDNRKCNLRLCTNSKNLLNSKKHKDSSSGFKGVRVKGKKYQATLTFNKKFYHLGYYYTAEEAAQAYDKKAFQLFGKYAKLNFKRE